jgi:hypothetical protein
MENDPKLTAKSHKQIVNHMESMMVTQQSENRGKKQVK